MCMGVRFTHRSPSLRAIYYSGQCHALHLVGLWECCIHWPIFLQHSSTSVYTQCCCLAIRRQPKVSPYFRLYSGLTLVSSYSMAYTVENPFPYVQLSCWGDSDLPEICLRYGSS